MSNVTFPNSVTSIGKDAFYGCSSLNSITIPNGVTSIGKSAFCGCSSLSSIIIPNSVTNIGECAFSGCSRLSGITIPNSLTSIGAYAFNYCNSLTDVYYTGNEEQWWGITFADYNDEEILNIATIHYNWTSVAIQEVTADSVRVEIQNNKAGTLYIAVYDAAGQLKQIVSQKVEKYAGIANIPLNNETLPENYRVKVFLLDDSDYSPLMESSEYPEAA